MSSQKTIDRALVHEKVTVAKSELAAAEASLEQAMDALRAKERAEKEIIGTTLDAAFDRLRAARKMLVELDTILSVDE